MSNINKFKTITVQRERGVRKIKIKIKTTNPHRRKILGMTTREREYLFLSIINFYTYNIFRKNIACIKNIKH